MILNRIVKFAGKLSFAAGIATLMLTTAQAQQTPVGPRPDSRPAAQPSSAAPDESRGGWRTACRADIKLLCKSAVGGSAKRKCLDANLTKQSAPCTAALNQRRQQRAATLMACTADLQNFCKENSASNGAKIQCLQAKAADVTPDCGKALTKLATDQPGGKGTGKAVAPKN